MGLEGAHGLYQLFLYPDKVVLITDTPCKRKSVCLQAQFWGMPCFNMYQQCAETEIPEDQHTFRNFECGTTGLFCGEAVKLIKSIQRHPIVIKVFQVLEGDDTVHLVGVCRVRVTEKFSEAISRAATCPKRHGKAGEVRGQYNVMNKDNIIIGVLQLRLRLNCYDEGRVGVSTEEAAESSKEQECQSTESPKGAKTSEGAVPIVVCQNQLDPGARKPKEPDSNVDKACDWSILGELTVSERVFDITDGSNMSVLKPVSARQGEKDACDDQSHTILLPDSQRTNPPSPNSFDVSCTGRADDAKCTDVETIVHECIRTSSRLLSKPLSGAASTTTQCETDDKKLSPFKVSYGNDDVSTYSRRSSKAPNYPPSYEPAHFSSNLRVPSGNLHYETNCSCVCQGPRDLNGDCPNRLKKNSAISTAASEKTGKEKHRFGWCSGKKNDDVEARSVRQCAIDTRTLFCEGTKHSCRRDACDSVHPGDAFSCHGCNPFCKSQTVMSMRLPCLYNLQYNFIDPQLKASTYEVTKDTRWNYGEIADAKVEGLWYPNELESKEELIENEKWGKVASALFRGNATEQEMKEYEHRINQGIKSELGDDSKAAGWDKKTDEKIASYDNHSIMEAESQLHRTSKTDSGSSREQIISMDYDGNMRADIISCSKHSIAVDEDRTLKADTTTSRRQSIAMEHVSNLQAHTRNSRAESIDYNGEMRAGNASSKELSVGDGKTYTRNSRVGSISPKRDVGTDIRSSRKQSIDLEYAGDLKPHSINSRAESIASNKDVGTDIRSSRKQSIDMEYAGDLKPHSINSRAESIASNKDVGIDIRSFKQPSIAVEYVADLDPLTINSGVESSASNRDVRTDIRSSTQQSINMEYVGDLEPHTKSSGVETTASNRDVITDIARSREHSISLLNERISNLCARCSQEHSLSMENDRILKADTQSPRMQSIGVNRMSKTDNSSSSEQSISTDTKIDRILKKNNSSCRKQSIAMGHACGLEAHTRNSGEELIANNGVMKTDITSSREHSIAMENERILNACVRCSREHSPSVENNRILEARTESPRMQLMADDRLSKTDNSSCSEQSISTDEDRILKAVTSLSREQLVDMENVILLKADTKSSTKQSIAMSHLGELEANTRNSGGETIAYNGDMSSSMTIAKELSVTMDYLGGMEAHIRGAGAVPTAFNRDVRTGIGGTREQAIAMEHVAGEESTAYNGDIRAGIRSTKELSIAMVSGENLNAGVKKCGELSNIGDVKIEPSAVSDGYWKADSRNFGGMASSGLDNSLAENTEKVSTELSSNDLDPSSYVSASDLSSNDWGCGTVKFSSSHSVNR